MTVWELIAPGVLPAVVAIVALIVTGRARGNERLENRLDAMTAAINDLSGRIGGIEQRVARIEGRLDISHEREAA